MLHHAESGHLRQRCLELGERVAISIEEPVEEEPPVRVAERLEDRFHAPILRDYSVTCQYLDVSRAVGEAEAAPSLACLVIGFVIPVAIGYAARKVEALGD